MFTCFGPCYAIFNEAKHNRLISKNELTFPINKNDLLVNSDGFCLMFQVSQVNIFPESRTPQNNLLAYTGTLENFSLSTIGLHCPIWQALDTYDYSHLNLN